MEKEMEKEKNIGMEKLDFEGQYLKGKKWNGKGFNINNEKVYEIKNGNGLVKEYNNEGKIIFVGEYLNGEKNGKGKEYSEYDNKLIFNFVCIFLLYLTKVFFFFSPI